MGTNYYLHTNVCACCGRGDEPVHIGKSSAGWCFSLHVFDDVQSLEDWQERWKTGVIKDEYGREVSIAEMLNIITDRAHPNPNNWSPEEMRANYAAPGPNNLVRHNYKATHGPGTWDLCQGDFS